MNVPRIPVGELGAHLGERFGPSEWVRIEQRRIDEFASASGDVAWYHVDTERAARELPGGRTFAHGLLTLALVPALSARTIELVYPRGVLHYGLEGVRFPARVDVGSRVRLYTTPVAVDPHPKGQLVRLEHSMESDEASKPVLVLTRITLALTEPVGALR